MHIIDLCSAIRSRYYISPLDLADSAETNRLHSNFVSFIFFIFGTADLLVLLVLYRNSLYEHFVSSAQFFTAVLFPQTHVSRGRADRRHKP